VTLHHFTSPRWVAAKGGWTWNGVVDAFGRFCNQAATHLCDDVDIMCTINEPNIVALHGYRTGLFAPGIQEPGARERATENFIAAHRRAVEAVKAGPGSPLVGLTLSMTDYQSVEGGESEMARLRTASEQPFLEAARDDDFIGVQTYTRQRVGPQGLLGQEQGVETTQMGYEFWPEALPATIRRAWEVCGDLPIIVTENGIGTSDDARRTEFVRRALMGVSECLAEGIDVRGYFYWSALDNFEWMFGYQPTFGLIAVDRETQERTAKESARWLGSIARANGLDIQIGP
jgi:beta-glucosidase